MRALEWRIQQEAAAAADEITPGDVPPLRLQPSRRRLRLRRSAASEWLPRAGGPWAPHSGLRWLTPLAAAVSLAAVVAFLVVLRAGTGAGGDTFPASISRAQAVLAKQALDAYFPASGSQYTAGLAFEWTRRRILAANTGPCLADAGFPQSPFSTSKGRFIFSVPNNGRFPDLALRARTHAMAPRGVVTGAHRGGQLPVAHQRAYAAAVLTCVRNHAHSLWRIDRTAEPLAHEWLRKVSRIQASAPVRVTRPGFVQCLEASGIPAQYAHSRPGQLFGGFFAWLKKVGLSSNSPARFAHQQRRWTAVFVRCARPTVEVMEPIQLAARAKFFAAHARQIALIRRVAIGLVLPRDT